MRAPTQGVCVWQRDKFTCLKTALMPNCCHSRFAVEAFILAMRSCGWGCSCGMVCGSASRQVRIVLAACRRWRRWLNHNVSVNITGITEKRR